MQKPEKDAHLSECIEKADRDIMERKDVLLASDITQAFRKHVEALLRADSEI